MKFLTLLGSLIFLIPTAAMAAVSQKPSVFVIDTILNQNATARSTGGGSITGFGGGDTVDQRKISAWFYGNHSINVCYQKIKSFGLTDSQVEASLLSSFALWTDYIQKKKINSSTTPPINTNFALKGKCRGGEDLVIYLGTGPIFQNLLDLKLFQSLSKPVAYVNKTHLSQDLTWSKGYIRFVENFSYKIDANYYPDWSRVEHFQLMLTHELGHVLGFTHIPETIMSSQIVKDLFVETKKYPHRIDFSRELYPCNTCLSVYKPQTITKHLPLFKDLHIALGDNTIELSRGEKNQAVTLTHIEKQNIPASLISNFQAEEAAVSVSSLYFFTYSGLHFVGIRQDNTLKIFENGSLVATFSRNSL